MKTILKEDISKITPAIEKVLEQLGSGNKSAEMEIEIGDMASIANIKSRWVRDTIIINIKFRK